MANSKSRKSTKGKNKKKAGELKDRPERYSNLYVNIPDNYLRLPAPAQEKPITPRAPKAPKTPRATTPRATPKPGSRGTPTPRKTRKSKKPLKNLSRFFKVFHRLRPGSKNKTVKI